MLMNYHELTMNEPRDSPARRRQFLVICTVMAGTMLYSVTSAGGFSSVQVTQGEFPGGDYVYKHTKRDYAASNGLARSIGEDLGLKPKELADVIYSIFLDNPSQVKNGRQQRFAAGLLVKKGQDGKQKKSLLEKNKSIIPATDQEILDLPARELWPKIEYKRQSLTKTKAAVVQFPFTDGFISALILSWKVIPALVLYVQENGGKDTAPVVISTCSVKEQMCTHYAPLSNSKPFLLGQPASKVYVETLEATPLLDFAAVKSSLKKMFPFYKYFRGMFASDEL